VSLSFNLIAPSVDSNVRLPYPPSETISSAFCEFNKPKPPAVTAAAAAAPNTGANNPPIPVEAKPAATAPYV
jgi:hypothetical protein